MYQVFGVHISLQKLKHSPPDSIEVDQRATSKNQEHREKTAATSLSIHSFAPHDCHTAAVVSSAHYVVHGGSAPAAALPLSPSLLLDCCE